MAFQLWKNLNYKNPLPIYYKLDYDSYYMNKLYDTYGPINTTNIFDRIQYTIYPEISKYQKCTAILLNNLFYPEWITIDCNEPVTSDIMCHFPRKIKQKLNGGIQTMELYNASCVHKNNTCFIFLWGNKSSRSGHKMLRKQINHINIFQYLFDAVSSTFPPIMLTDRYTMSYIRFGNIFSYKITEPKKSTETLQIFTQIHHDPRRGGNIFQCNQFLISINSLCDGKVDCENNHKLDEINCRCKERDIYSSNCKYITSDKSPKYCSDFYITTIHNNCWPFSKLKCLSSRSKEDNINFCNFPDASGSKFVGNSMHTNDYSVSGNGSCTWDVLTNVNVNCISQGLLSCTNKNSECYEISEICNYLLDKKDCLIPCRGGEHLQNCRDVECNMKFKCPSYYCVPWYFVCDGKWDCPGGLDEDNCNHKRVCKNMYKCKNSVLCIHPYNICDGNFDCPAGEDEFYCSLDKINCPLSCECLMFAIRCVKLRTSDIYLKNNHPYHVIIIMRSTNSFVITLLKFSGIVTVLKVSRNNLNVLCSILPCINRTQLVDAGHNKIRRLSAKCFQQASYLKTIKLNNNNIFLISNGAFEELDKLIIMDLSYNMLTTFSGQTFRHIPNLRLLRLGGNEIKSMDFNAFQGLNIHILESTSQSMICIPSLKIPFMIIRKPWFVLCTDLLMTDGIRICSFCMFLAIISFSMILLKQQVIFYRNGIKIETFTLTVLSLNVIDISYGLYILCLFFVDIYYKERFGFYQNQWKSSDLCFLCFALALNFSLVSTILVCFVASERLLVVLYPLHTTFKKTEFVRRCIFVITVICFVVVTCITNIMKSVNKHIPLALCSPFVDPTKSILFLKVISFFIIIYQFSAVIFVSVTHFMISVIVHRSNKNVSKTINKKTTQRLIFIQLIILTLACLVSWVPSGIVYLSTWFLDKYSIDIIIWTAIAVTPIELIVRSLVFILVSTRVH